MIKLRNILTEPFTDAVHKQELQSMIKLGDILKEIGTVEKSLITLPNC